MSTGGRPRPGAPGQQARGCRSVLARGRYDGNHVIVYFDAVKFGNTFPKDAKIIPIPIAESFFDPMELPRSYVARIQDANHLPRFAIGDRYDLLLGNGVASTITLTSLVGFASDEAAGNKSYIGALATPKRPDELLFTKNYYAVRKHIELAPDSPELQYDPKTPIVWLDSDPARFDIQSSAAMLITERMKSTGLPEARLATNFSPELSVQRFTIADGSTRYFIWADWRDDKKPYSESIIRMGAWMTESPSAQLLAVEPPGVADGLRKENLLNVVDLGAGKTGIIVYVEGGDTLAIQLLEYRDRARLEEMRVLQTIAVGG
jgi:hypothetical protein